MLTNYMGGILSQCIIIPKHYAEHFNYITILFVYYTPLRLKKIKLQISYSISRGKVNHMQNSS